MGCCVSKKLGEPPGAAGEAHGRKPVVVARDLAPPEEEKVKEVLSETPRVKPRPRPRRLASGAVVAPSADKVKPKDGGARVKDGVGGARVGSRTAAASWSVEERSEAASESSAATTVAGPERSPSKPPRCRQGRPAQLGGEPRRARRDRDHGAAVPGRRGRASPSPPPPRRDTGRRSPSPAAKRAQDQRRDAAGAQRKPPVPARPCSRAPTPPRAQDALPQPPAAAKPHPHGPPTHCPSPPTPQVPEQEDTDTPPVSDGGAAAGEGEGEGKEESLENPLVSMECFIFL